MTTDSGNVSEGKENILAVTIFILLLIISIGLFTDGFGLMKDKEDDGERVDVPLGNDPFIGPNTAPVVIVGFSDYECTFCGKAETTINSILDKYPEEIVYVFKDLPLTSIHKDSYSAALAAECAKEQRKFWEYHNHLFANQDRLTIDNLKEHANILELDSESFDRCLDEKKYQPEVEKDIRAAKQISVSSTPTFFINGRRLTGAYPEEEFIEIIEEELKLKQQ